MEQAGLIEVCCLDQEALTSIIQDMTNLYVNQKPQIVACFAFYFPYACTYNMSLACKGNSQLEA
jgi:hypothetical protein